MDVEVLKTQHGRIIRLASALGGIAAVLKTSDDATRARELMSALNVALTEHLAIEDGELYPVLMQSEDVSVRDLAQHYARKWARSAGFGRTISWNGRRPGFERIVTGSPV